MRLNTENIELGITRSVVETCAGCGSGVVSAAVG
jgi:hypothetical protein